MNKCQNCGSNNLDKGLLEESHYKSTNIKSFWPWRYLAKISACLCLQCGNLSFSVEENELNKFKK